MSAASAEQAPRLSASWMDALAQLDEDLRRTNAAPRTRRAYAIDTLQFGAWADARELAPAGVGVRDIRRYIAHLSERGLSATTTARKLAAIRALFRSQREHGHIEQSPADLLSTPRRGSYLPRVLKAPEMGRLLDSIPAGGDGGPLNLRDRALFELAYACGLRAEEIVSLDLSDVDHEAEQLRVEGKGSKTRFVPAGEVALGAVRAYLERARPALARPALARTPTAGAANGEVSLRRSPGADREQAALFLSRTGRRLSTSDVRRRSARLVDAGGSAGRTIPARAAPQLCYPPARRWRGPAHDPRAARTFEHLYHAGLHSGRVRQTQKRLCAQSPSGLIGGRRPWRRTSKRSSCANCGGAISPRTTLAPASGWLSPTRRWSSTWPVAQRPACLRMSRRPTWSPTGSSG